MPKELLDSLHEKLVILDDKQQFLFVNQAAIPLFHENLAELMGQPFPLDVDFPGVVTHTVGESTYRLRLHKQPLMWEGQSATLISLEDMTVEERLLHELATQSEYFHMMMRNAPDLLAIFNGKGKLLYINPAMEHTLGYSVEESTNSFLVNYFDHPEASSLDHILSLLPTEPDEQFGGTIHVAHKNGELRSLSAIVTSTLGPEGELIYIANCHDITATIQQERQLHETQTRFQMLFKVMPHPILIVRIRDWEIVDANDYHLKHPDLYLIQLIGTRITRNSATIPEFDDVSRVFQETGQVSGYPITMNDGQEEYSFLVYAQQIEYEGEDCALVSFVDFTEQKEVESELARLYDATSYLFQAESMQDLAERIVQGIVKEFNQVDCGLLLSDQVNEQLVRVARAGEYTINLDTAVHIDGAGLVPQAYRKRQHLYAPDVSQDEAYVPNVPTTRSEFVIPLKTSSGCLGVLDFQSRELDGFSESDRRLLQVFSERAAAALENMRLYEEVQLYAETLEYRVEERTQELQESLEKQRELLRVKTRFVSMVSHEYRTPLTIISSSASILQHYADRIDDKQKARHLGKIQIQVQKLADMVQTVLQMNQAETIGMDFHPEDVDARDVLNEIIGEFQDRYPEQSITLGVTGTYQTTLLDGYLFRMIAEHLIENAVKYLPEKSSISCRLDYQDDKLLFQVEDQGIGIPENDQAEIFTNFFRAQNVGQIPGTGLGLPLVRQAVETHNGSLHIDSTVGIGTTVTATFPYAVS